MIADTSTIEEVKARFNRDAVRKAKQVGNSLKIKEITAPHMRSLRSLLAKVEAKRRK